ncbi:MAG: glycine cleavage system protein GcvH [Burkholderiaceae bacterium]
MIKYSEDHVWLAMEGDNAVVGITSHAQETLGDVVFVELPTIGQSLQAKEVAGVVESVKAAADVHMPVAGQIIAVNEELRADPSLANSDPLGAGWFFKISLSDRSQLDSLLDERAYTEFSA